MNIIEALYGAREERGKGVPLTDEERAQRHSAQYGTTVLPPRGTGLGQSSETGIQPFWRKDNPWMWVALAGGCFVLYRLMSGKKKRAEQRVRIKGNPLLPFESSHRGKGKERNPIHNTAKISSSLLKDMRGVVGSIYRMNAPHAVGYAFDPDRSGKKIARGMFIDRGDDPGEWTYYYSFSKNEVVKTFRGMVPNPRRRR